MDRDRRPDATAARPASGRRAADALSSSGVLAQDQPARAWRFAVAGLYLLIAGAFCAIVIWRFAIFRYAVDLGIFTQVVAGVGHGFSSTAEGGVNHLLVHWSPIVALAWPFVKAFGPEGLELLQACAVAATLLPIWGMASARFRPRVAFALTAICALYPLLCANAVGDFHEMAFVPLLSACLVWAIDRRRFGWGILIAVLLACTKEDQFLVLLWIGGVLTAFARADADLRRFGAIVAAIGVGMTGLYFGVVRHLLSPAMPYYALHFYDWTQPVASSQPFVGPRVAYVLAILGPLAFVPVFSRYALFLIPGFVEVFASHEPVVLSATSHYSAIFTGYALGAFVDGSAALAARARVFAASGAACAALASIAVSIWASPMEYWYYLYRLPNAHDAKLAAMLDALPKDGDIGTEDELFAHLAMDPNASIAFHGQRYFVYDRTQFSARFRDVDLPAAQAALKHGTYAIVTQADGITVIERR
jgi:uncharacterized membrane protein